MNLLDRESFEYQYISALQKCLIEGVSDKNNRTGVGTLRIPHVQFKVDLSKELPFVKTKKLQLKSLTQEILWIMQKQSNVVADLGNHIWDEWTGADGTIGKAYGYQIAPTERSGKIVKVPVKFKIFESIDNLKTKFFDDVDIENSSIKNDMLGVVFADEVGTPYKVVAITEQGEDDFEYTVQAQDTGYITKIKDLWKFISGECYTLPNPYRRDWYGVGYLGSGDIRYADIESYKLFSLWLDMMKSVYGENGEYEVGLSFVCERWHNFSNFEEDIHMVDNFRLYLKDSDSYVLSPKYYNSDCYSLDTCVFLHKSELVDYATKRVYCYRDSLGVVRKVFLEEGSVKMFEDALGVSAVLLEPKEGYVYRYELAYNQINNLINTIKSDPSSRRMVLNLWNVSELDEMNLQPCCLMSIWDVVDGKLNCMLIQRSGDSMLGVPFNTAQYSILVHLVAKATGLQVGVLTHNIADFHIYDNAVAGAELQIHRYKELETYINLKSIGYDKAISLQPSEVLNVLQGYTEEELDSIVNTNVTLSLPDKSFYEFELSDIVINNYTSLDTIHIDVVS